MSDPRFIVGVDLGQVVDFTAIAIGELAGEYIQIRHLERRPLGESYPAVVDHVTGLVRALPGAPELVVDATGVGRPVVDMMRGSGVAPIPVTMTIGKAAWLDRRGMWRVPKPVLLLPLITAVEADRLMIAAGLPVAEALMLELRAFERTVTPHANEKYGGRGQHDDLVIAAALVCWRGDMLQTLSRVL